MNTPAFNVGLPIFLPSIFFVVLKAAFHRSYWLISFSSLSIFSDCTVWKDDRPLHLYTVACSNFRRCRTNEAK